MNVKETFIFPYPRWHSLWHFPPCRVFVVTCREKMIAAPMGHYRFYISSFFSPYVFPFWYDIAGQILLLLTTLMAL